MKDNGNFALKMYKQAFKILPLTVALAVSLASCERRDLDEAWSATTKVEVDCDWSHMNESPTGMTMYFFKDGETTPRVISTSEVYSVQVSLDEGHWKMFLINQSVYEFSSLEFFNMSEYDLANACVAEVTSKWYAPSKAGDTPTKADYIGHAPESLGIGIAEEFDITEEMIESYQYSWEEYTKNTKNTKADEETLKRLYKRVEDNTYVIPVVAYDVVDDLTVRVNLTNVSGLRSVRASVTNLAQQVTLTTYGTAQTLVDQLLESWTLYTDASDEGNGYVESTVSTFGLPGAVTDVTGRDASLNVLTVSFLMSDGTTITKDYEVGDKFQITVDEDNQYHLYLYLEVGPVDLPDVIPDEQGGGFKADVVDWDNQQEAVIPV